MRDLDPQLARGKLEESYWEDPNWIAEEKYDGERRLAHFEEGLVRFTGRRSKTTGQLVEKSAQLPQLSGTAPIQHKGRTLIMKPPPELAGTVLDGEVILDPGITVDGGRSKMVTAIANSSAFKAIQKQEANGWLLYMVFDCLFWKGQDIRGLPLYERKERAREAVDLWRNFFALLAPRAKSHKQQFLRRIYDNGGEGAILKRRDHLYGDEAAWVKVKKILTADVVIMGFKDAKEMSKKVNGEVSITKYAEAGLIGAIIVGQYKPTMMAKSRADPVYELDEVATVSGIDDELRRELTAKPKKYLGRVITIQANDREPTGRFRHPRFLRFRSDKAPEACRFNLDER